MATRCYHYVEVRSGSSWNYNHVRTCTSWKQKCLRTSATAGNYGRLSKLCRQCSGRSRSKQRIMLIAACSMYCSTSTSSQQQATYIGSTQKLEGFSANLSSTLAHFLQQRLLTLLLLYYFIYYNSFLRCFDCVSVRLLLLSLYIIYNIISCWFWLPLCRAKCCVYHVRM